MKTKIYKDFIAIDASRCFIKNPTGVEIYSQKIVKSILKINKQNKILLYSKQNFENIPKNIKIKIIQARRFWTIFYLQKEIIKNPPKTLFVPSSAIPFFIPYQTNCITTIHDVAFMKNKKSYSYFNRFYLENSTKRAVKYCKKIIVPSTATENNLKKYFNCNPKKIVKISMGLQKSDYMDLEPQKKEKYFLFVGRVEEKKNLKNAIHGFNIFVKKNKDFKFIICGKDGFGSKEIKKNAKNKKIIFKGFVSEEVKKKLIKNATALILPSRDEGFGFPILEAQILKTLVLASNILSNKETSGKYAIFFDSNDIAKIATAMFNSLEKNDKIIKNGFENACKYDWNICGKKTLEVLREY